MNLLPEFYTVEKYNERGVDIDAQTEGVGYKYVY